MLPTDTAYHAVDFIPTFTGRAFFPRSPRAADITIIDIAHHLAAQCRYTGATVSPYSTAQHCCLLADYVLKSRKGTALDCLQILMHDAAEAWITDVPRPLKQYMPEYRNWDHDVTMCVRGWLGLDGVPIPEWQDELDSRIIADERAQVMSDQSLDWEHDVEPLDVVIEPWSARFAEQQFLMRYASYSAQVFGSHQYLRSGWGLPTTAKYQPDFRTQGGDVTQQGPTDPDVITDLIEVDLRGGCGRVALRSPDGMMIRDLSAGSFPRPAWKFIHGNFELKEAGNAVA